MTLNGHIPGQLLFAVNEGISMEGKHIEAVDSIAMEICVTWPLLFTL
jgi:hypothetical protein